MYRIYIGRITLLAGILMSAAMFSSTASADTKMAFWGYLTQGLGRLDYNPFSSKEEACLAQFKNTYRREPDLERAPQNDELGDHYFIQDPNLKTEAQEVTCAFKNVYYENPRDEFTIVFIAHWEFTCPGSEIFNISKKHCVGLLVPPKDLSCQNPSSEIGNPIDLATGEKNQEEIDLLLGENSPLKMSRYYNSGNSSGWMHDFSEYMLPNDTSAVVTLSSGRSVYFSIEANGSYKGSAATGVLTKTSTGWEYRVLGGKVFGFDALGYLSYIRGPKDYYISVARNKDGSKTISNKYGNSFTYTEDERGQLTNIKSSAVEINYTYTSIGNSRYRLTQVTKNYGSKITFRQYEYDNDSQLLIAIIDENGVKNAAWTYDNQSRANSSQHAGGAYLINVLYPTKYSSLPAKATVTNELGKETVYNFININGVNFISSIEGMPSANCPAGNSSFEYNEIGQIIKKIDAKGYVTTYTYNDLGLETSRTEAADTSIARTTTTEWDLALLLPTKIITATQITSYTYDKQGRETGRQVSAR